MGLARALMRLKAVMKSGLVDTFWEESISMLLVCDYAKGEGGEAKGKRGEQ